MLCVQPAGKPRAASFSLWFDSLAIAAALLARFIPFSPEWIEHVYANGAYPHIDHAVRGLTGPLPFTLGDVLFFIALAALVAWWIRALRGPRGRALAVRFGFVALRTVAVLALVFVWFEFSWAFNYERVPLADKIPLHNERVTPAAVNSFADHVVDELNLYAAAAHKAPSSDEQTEVELVPRFDAVVSRLGDRSRFPPPTIKHTVFQFMMEDTGTTGFTDPWTHEVNVDESAYFFERPAIYAHEWGHISGFADEAEANLISVLACTTSPDPLLRYSGWMLAFFNLGRDVHVKHKLNKQALADVRAVVARYRKHVKPALEKAQRAAYDKYLKANRVGAGVKSYGLFVNWLVGADYDEGGLPIVKTTFENDAP